MTDLRQAAQQALEALETCGEDEWHSEDDFGMVQTYDEDKVAKGVTALRTALEQQAEPVAWNAGVAPMWPQQKEGETFSVSYTTTPQPEQQAEPPPTHRIVSWGQCGVCRHDRIPGEGCARQECPDAPQQQAETVAMRMPKVGDKVICLEDESLGTVESLTAGGSPDITFDDGTRGTYLLREFAELFSYVAPPQRPWVGLTDEEKKHIATAAGCTEDDDGHIVTEIFRLAEDKVKEKNSD